ncbi:glycosyl transferase [Amycolatopsis sp. lyj-23]|uniref:glycosyl transferase n=1 Tax=Amycolatopsis sp. lyj-23 TaxID=2789283 RepID=UPI00397AE20D
MAQHRPVSAAHRLLSLDLVLALSALAGGLRVLYLAAEEPALPTEAATVAHVYALGHLTSFADTGGAGVSPFGWLQLAAATMVSDAFGRSPTALAAVREAVLFASLAGAVLVWILARRLGLTRWASSAAVLLLAASPLALGVQRLVVVEHLAAVWALGALVLITRPHARIRHDAAAAACLLAAVLTSPLALSFLPAAGWLLVRRAPARAALVAVVLNLGLGLAFGPAAAVLRPHLAAPTDPSAADWAALDPAWAVLTAVALVAGLAVKPLRPLAATGVLLAATLLVPGVPDTAALALVVPVAPVLVAGVAQAVFRRGAPGRGEQRWVRPGPAEITAAWRKAGRHGGEASPGDVVARSVHAREARSADFVRAVARQLGSSRRTEFGSDPHSFPAHRRDATGPHPGSTRSGDPNRQCRTETAPADTTCTAQRRDASHPEPATPTAAARPAHHSRRAHRRVGPALLLGAFAAFAVSWGVGYPALHPALDRGGPLASARDWLQANASGSRLLVDDAAWAELAGSGWPTGLLAPPAACAVTCPAAEWAVFGDDGTGLRQRLPSLEAAFTGAGATAVFGSGTARITVWRLGLPPADPAAPPEAPARAHAGEALTASARIALTAQAAEVLREGCADPRLITTIAALAAIQPVGVAAFPEVPGEDAAGQPRRRVLLTGGEAGTTAFYAGQRDLFRPASVVRTAEGVLVTYPLFAPPGLLVR